MTMPYQNFYIVRICGNMEKYNVYVIDAWSDFTGHALIAAESAEAANLYLENERMIGYAGGYNYTSEDDKVDNVFATEKGIVYSSIDFCGARKW